MAYIGSPPASAVLSSADIAQGAVTLNDINFTDQPTNMDITGVIDKHTMRLADGVTITGDVTISDDLVLSKISDDGNAITMTNDGSSRTITGSGSIEASTLTQTPNASLTGMTGTVGSGVTGSPALNLENATFPAGHVLKVFSTTMTAPSTLDPGSAWVDISGLSVNITPSSTSSKILITGIVSLIGRDGYNNAGLRVLRNGSETGYQGDSSGSRNRAFSSIVGDKTNDATGEHAMNYLDSPSSTSVLTYKVQAYSNGVVYINRSYSNADNINQHTVASTITVMEIAG